MQAYRVALRVVKYWAKQRGLYSNVLGFLGGVNFAILVAFVSQQFPNACPFTLVQKFFAIYSMWNWPVPVFLRNYEDLKFKDSDGRYLPVWNPYVNYKDRLHIMPIITPAYPAMNSAYNISLPQFRRIHVGLLSLSYLHSAIIFSFSCRRSLCEGIICFNHICKKESFLEQLSLNHRPESFSKSILGTSKSILVQQTPPTIVSGKLFFLDLLDLTWRLQQVFLVFFRFGWVESRIRMLIVALDKVGVYATSCFTLIA
jgi:hypothetical protein